MSTPTETTTPSALPIPAAAPAAVAFFAADFARLRAAEPSAHRLALRESAWQHFERQGFPTLRQEEWRFTNVAPVGKTAFRRPVAAVALDGDHDVALAAGVEAFRLAGTIELVFVDGRFDAALSAKELPAGLTVALAGESSRADALLGSVSGIDTRPFAALATALFEELAFVEVAAGAVVEQPLHLLFYSTAQETPGASFPRTLIHAGSHGDRHGARRRRRPLQVPARQPRGLPPLRTGARDRARRQRLDAFVLARRRDRPPRHPGAARG